MRYGVGMGFSRAGRGQVCLPFQICLLATLPPLSCRGSISLAQSPPLPSSAPPDPSSPKGHPDRPLLPPHLDVPLVSCSALPGVGHPHAPQ